MPRSAGYFGSYSLDGLALALWSARIPVQGSFLPGLGLGLRISGGLGFRVGLGGLGFRGLGFRGLGFRVEGLGASYSSRSPYKAESVHLFWWRYFLLIFFRFFSAALYGLGLSTCPCRIGVEPCG